ncbi:hypothetical protein [Actinoplanes sp. NBRC 103695]|uniref:hypothetical protein n=1 Tax=Actinoplanes sp. NBRC 103695 TaxID=3032202 RepID=UPI0024A5F421|nr:hypothetical protein [Actinoplanes sp. NBRC 103695]GLZ00084.1 hypothetical protein Acsp02_73360 [Actinoplanes sp. NBRC 103695]
MAQKSTADGSAGSRPLWPEPWAIDVATQADRISHRVRAAVAAGGEDAVRAAYREAIESHLTAARQAARSRGRALKRGPADRWRGTSIELAYRHLHEAKVFLTELVPEDELDELVPEVQAKIAYCLPPDDVRRLRLGEFATRADQGSGRKRAAISQAMQIIYSATDQMHARIRSFRNLVLSATALIAVFGTALIVVVYVKPELLPMCFYPSAELPGSPAGAICPSGAATPTANDIIIIVGIGTVGGVLASLFAIRKVRGTSTPYNIPVALAVFKVPVGALFAVAGVLLMGGGFLPGVGGLDSQRQILAYALVFGFAQLLATRLIDARGISLLNELPGGETPAPRSLFGPSASTEGPAQHLLSKVPEVVTDQVRSAILGPPLVNFDGWVSVAVLHDGALVAVGEDRRVALVRGRSYSVLVTVGPSQVAELAERLVVTGGVDRPAVEFSAEIDSDQPALRREPEPVRVSSRSAGSASFDVSVDDPVNLWIRVAQGRRTLQSISLLIVPA